MAIAQDNRELIRRIQILVILVTLVFLALALKIWHLTIVRYDYYAELASRNQMRTIPLTAPRGLVADREGRPLIENELGFNLFIERDQMKNSAVSLDFLESGMGLGRELVSTRMAGTHYQSVLLKDNLQLDEVAFLLSHRAEHPELSLLEQPRRKYRHGEFASHVLGFVGEVSKAELELPELGRAKPGDIVGKSGIEKVLNDRLTGVDGYRRVFITSYGKTLEEVQRVDPVQGSSIQLTLDFDLQAVAEEELEGRTGSIVALDPRSGEVLAMASSPGFDPNLFASRISSDAWQSLVENPDRPFQNRAIQSTYSPGSIFKIVMALAGLESGLVDTETSVYCAGGVELYGHWFRCWNAGGHGRIRLKEAIQHSCNVYFYLLGRQMGIEKIAEFSRRLGLGQVTGLELPGEVLGIVPSSAWKRQRSGERWYEGETISVSIGQGPLVMTPVQLARAIGIAATGLMPRIHLIRGNSESPGSLDFDPQHLTALRHAMWSVVNDGGTGRGARVAGFDVCGKTGTAQTISRDAFDRLPEDQRQRFEPNAWFAGFAPRDNPEIVVTVIVQRGGSGGSAAAPIAGNLISAYYRKYKASPAENLILASSEPAQ